MNSSHVMYPFQQGFAGPNQQPVRGSVAKQAFCPDYATEPHVHKSKERVYCLVATDGSYRPKPLTFHCVCNRILRRRLDIRYFRRTLAAPFSERLPRSM